MNHPLFVGYFDPTVRSSNPKVTASIDLDRVEAILIKHCDRGPDKAPVAAAEDVEITPTCKWLGRINKEDVLFMNGYLICPWLGCGINKASVAFIEELYSSLGVQILEPGDGAFYSPEQLAEIEREVFRIPKNKHKSVR
jgi:hypothetical protein